MSVLEQAPLTVDQFLMNGDRLLCAAIGDGADSRCEFQRDGCNSARPVSELPLFIVGLDGANLANRVQATVASLSDPLSAILDGLRGRVQLVIEASVLLLCVHLVLPHGGFFSRLRAIAPTAAGGEQGAEDDRAEDSHGASVRPLRHITQYPLVKSGEIHGRD